jgi:hypothetical protein
MDAAQSAGRAQTYTGPAICLVVVFIFHLFLIHQTSTIFWNDAHIRWALRDRLLLGEWLPGVQVFIFLIARITSSLDHLQIFMSLLALCVLFCFHGLAQILFSHTAGWVTVLMLGFNALFAAFAIVPYSIMLFAGLACLTFIFLDAPVFSGRFYAGILLINLACLTSYEGWFLALFFILQTAVRCFRTMDWRAAGWQSLKMSVLCSAAPVLWLIAGSDRSGGLVSFLNSIFRYTVTTYPATISDHILVRLDIHYLVEFSTQFFRLLIFEMRPDFLLLAMLGLWSALPDPNRHGLHQRILLFLVMDWVLLAIVQPWGFGNPRQPFLMLVFLMPYAAHGLLTLVSWVAAKLETRWRDVRPARDTWLLTAFSVPVLIISLALTSFLFVKRASQGFVTTYTIARWLDLRLTDGDAVLVLDDSSDYPYVLASYMDFPVGSILDDRQEDDLMVHDLTSARNVYIIALYRSRDGLNPNEERVLDELERGHIPADHFEFDKVSIWYAPADKVSY